MSIVFRDAPVSAASALASVPKELALWFRARYGEPTEIQRIAWPVLLAGGHVLISAPTGTGKTLSAMLPILGALIFDAGKARGVCQRPGFPMNRGVDTLPSPLPGGRCNGLRVLIVAPLKALVNDAARNLQRDLDDLAESCLGRSMPRIGIRTGDTPYPERKRQRDDPPEILFTTPESLAVLLTRSDSSLLFGSLMWLVVDEVHAFAGTKRGADLALSLERLAANPSGGSFCSPRRVGLSATATPLVQAARFLTGNRPCTIVRVGSATPPELRLEALKNRAGNVSERIGALTDPARPPSVFDSEKRFLSAVLARLGEEIPRYRTILVFTNSRSLCERLAWGLRRTVPSLDGRVAVHHSALSANRRRETEARLKRGELAVVVSSTSLELGIDIGGIDLVVLVHPPGDVIRLLQRVGRAGHDPSGIRRGLVLTETAAELLEAAVTIASARSGQCESLPVVKAPLDVLCQHILGACCQGPCEADALYEMVRGAAPYADLTRDDFNDCLNYLRGVDREGRAWLPSRLRAEGDLWRVRDMRTVRLLRRNLGTILADQTVPVALRTSGATERGEDLAVSTRVEHRTLSPVGELDEAFAERLTPGDRFLLDGRCLEFVALSPEAAIVIEVSGRPRVPRWGGDGWPLSAELANRLYLLRTLAAEALHEGQSALRNLLICDYGLSGAAVELLMAHFQQQEAVSEIPDATTLLVEVVNVGVDTEYYLHTPLNRTGNDALARVAQWRLGRSATTQVADLGFMIKVRGDEFDPATMIRRLLNADGFAVDHAASLATSDAVRRRFGRVATTGLMVLRNPIGRTPRVGGEGWASRELFDRLRRRDANFILLRQAAREVADEVSDRDAALTFAQRLPSLTVRTRRLDRPSPFASAWTQQESGPSEEPLSPAEALKRLHAELTNAVRTQR